MELVSGPAVWYSCRRKRASCNPMTVLEREAGKGVRVCMCTDVIMYKICKYLYICTVRVCICTNIIMYNICTYLYICTVRVCIKCTDIIMYNMYILVHMYSKGGICTDVIMYKICKYSYICIVRVICTGIEEGVVAHKPAPKIN